MAGNNFDSMTIDDLCEWANSLYLGRFLVVERRGERIAVAEDDDVEIVVRFARITCSLQGYGRLRGAFCIITDKRGENPKYLSCASDYQGEMASRIYCNAERLGLCRRIPTEVDAPCI